MAELSSCEIIYVHRGQSPRELLPPYLFGLAAKSRMLLQQGIGRGAPCPKGGVSEGLAFLGVFPQPAQTVADLYLRAPEGI